MLQVFLPQEKSNFPNDVKSNMEFVSNFIKVGNSTMYLNEKLKGLSSNYSKKEVDIFAPGTNIYSTSVNGGFEFGNGTSYSAPMVSGVAALLFSYYPNLTASQVKHIIMDSGVEYTFPVKVRISGTKKDTLIPFNQLSKSGKIVNAYNALIMADSISIN
jgi:subtilisin family serine protease